MYCKSKLFFIFLWVCLNASACQTDGNDLDPEINKSGMSVLKLQNDTLFIQSKYGKNYDLQIQFTKCMFNNLMTFWNVGLVENTNNTPKFDCTEQPTVTMSQAFSDNVGPVAVSNGIVSSWMGGNHSYREQNKLKTAYTESYSFWADGKELKEGDHFWAKKIKVLVINKLSDLGKPVMTENEVTGFSSFMCTEKVEYLIQDGNIEVKVSHQWHNEIPYTIASYCGFQSMAQGKKVFFPRGHTSDFIEKINKTSRNKSEYPNVNRFIQKGADNLWYESGYLINEGIGNHDLVSQNEFIYLVDWGKTYHRLITNYKVDKNTHYSWRGVYSYILPIIDNEQLLAYTIKDSDGTKLIVDIKQSGNHTFFLPNVGLTDFSICEKDAGININSNLNGSFSLSAKQKGSLVLLLVSKLK